MMHAGRWWLLLALLAFTAFDAHATPGRAPSALALRLTVPHGPVPAEGPLVVTVELKNVSKQRVSVYSHVATHETHYDWLRVRLRYPGPSREGCSRRVVGRRSRWVRFIASRDKSVPIKKALRPGEAIKHTVDLRGWARRKVNGGFALGGGFYQLQAVYRVSEAEARSAGVWGGELRSKPARLTVKGRWQPGMCRTNPGWDRF